MEIANFVALIAEDEDTIASILSRLLKKEFNFDIHVANGYSKALVILQDLQPDLIFIDVNLGDGNGYDLLKALKSNQKKACKVIMMSAYSNETDLLDESKPKVDFFVSKPFDRKELIDAVKKVLSPENEEEQL